MANDYEKTIWQDGDYIDFENLNKIERYLANYISPVGDRGPIGETGEQGEQGITGIKGPIGSVGPKGETGDIGPRGDANTIKGEIGEQGPQGEVGSDGNEGVIGPTGEIGDTGPEGIKGLTGSKGPVGDQGPKGQKGDTGAQGTKGSAPPLPTYKFFQHVKTTGSYNFIRKILAEIGYISDNRNIRLCECIIADRISIPDTYITSDTGLNVDIYKEFNKYVRRPFICDGYLVYGAFDDPEGVRIFKSPSILTNDVLNNRLGIEQLKDKGPVEINVYDGTTIGSAYLKQYLNAFVNFKNLYRNNKSVVFYTISVFRAST